MFLQPEVTELMAKKVIQTDNAPAAVGPYSQGITANGFVFTAGQLPMNPETGELIDGDIQQQARQALNNAGQVLEAAGSSLANVVKVTVFLADINDFASVNEVYADVFDATGAPPPARSAFEVANLPLGARIEIEMIATTE